MTTAAVRQRLWALSLRCRNLQLARPLRFGKATKVRRTPSSSLFVTMVRALLALVSLATVEALVVGAARPTLASAVAPRVTAPPAMQLFGGGNKKSPEEILEEKVRVALASAVLACASC